jgi:hypothetical protein
MTNLFKSLINALSLVLCVCAVDVARADMVPITGTRFESLPAATLSGPCNPVPTLFVNNTIGIATGTSNFGDFTPDMTACLHTPFPAAITDGVFTWTFDDGDTLDGTWSGFDTRVNLPGGGHLVTINESYIVTGGTGAFLDATGEIDEMGLAVSTGTSATTNYTFEGTVTGPNLIATPEPDSLVLLGTGFLTMIMATSVRRRFS